MAVVLALDIGSSFVKAQRFDETGTPVGTSVRRPAHMGPDGRAALDDVVAGLEAVVDEVLVGAPSPDAVGIATAWHTLVGVDRNGVATTEVSTWMDERAGVDAAELRTRVADADDVHHRVGAPIHPSVPSARLYRLARREPDRFVATRRWCSLQDAVASRWFGDAVGPSSSAVSGSGLYDQRASAWDEELSAIIGVGAGALSPVEDEPRTGLAGDYRRRWPALADVKWFPAVGDGAAAVIGSGCGVPGRAALTVGTSAAVRTLVDESRRWEAPLPTALFGYLLGPGRPVVGAARSNGGSAASWVAGVLGLAGDDPVGVATSGRRPGAHGLVVDPSLMVERSPDWPVAGTASIAGMRRSTTAVDILQAFVEAVALGIADAVDAFETWAGPHDLVLGGGASVSTGWRRLLADVLGRPLTRSSVVDDSARGAALMALSGLGVSVRFDSAAEEAVDPDPARAEAFAELRASRPPPAFGASWGP